MKKRKIAVLGSSGSLGAQTLEVLSGTENIEITALAVHSNIDLLETQIREFAPEIAAVFDEARAMELRRRTIGLRTEVLSGKEGVLAAAKCGADLAVNCLVGAAGLGPTMAALESGSDIALANKESLVIGGELVMAKAAEMGAKLLPVDGEHSAVFQCLQGNEGNKLQKIILTASGGPFRGFKKEELENVTPEDALKHPVWNMGKRITIDCATMMNKGFEVIEAVWLFDIPIDDVEVLVHPQGIIHSMVEFEDGAIMAQLGTPDMRLPIQYAVNFPKRLPGPAKKTDFAAIKTLTFDVPDIETFPCLRLAREAYAAGGTAPAVLNAADEEAVRLFLEGKIKFTDIPVLIEKALLAYTVRKVKGLDDIFRADAWAREYVKGRMKDSSLCSE